MRIAVTGKTGQVVTALKALEPDLKDTTLILIGRPEVDLGQSDGLAESLSTALRAARPDVIISAAAYTAVDKAESEPDLALAVNGVAPGIIAGIADELGVPVVHLSTDYVFSGDKTEPYTETDATGPVSVYGSTKLTGERAIAAATANHVILRTAWVYSPYGANFVKTMLRLATSRDELGVVADQRGCPTSAAEIARGLIAVARRVVADPDPALRGVFHLTAQGEASWAEFATAIFEGARQRGAPAAKVNPIPASAYPTPARRPVNSRLNGQKLHDTYTLRLDPWPVSLETCLNQLIPTPE